jgi:hypothetical protein
MSTASRPIARTIPLTFVGLCEQIAQPIKSSLTRHLGAVTSSGLLQPGRDRPGSKRKRRTRTQLRGL